MNRISKTFNNFADSLVIYSQRYGKISWLIFLIIFACIMTITFNFPAQSTNKTQEKPEIRGVWLTNIDSEVLFKPEILKDALDRLADLNFNTIYPTVWNWGYTLYPSKVAEKVTGRALDPHESLKNRDFLKEIISQGHRKKLRIIPWFEFGFMAPADSELAKRHPDWLTQRQDKSVIWWEGKVHQRVWLNPLHPQVQNFITDLVSEIITNYDIEGIQFDEAWIQWRADKITDYMNSLAQTIKKQQPRAIISLSPNPYTFSLQSYLLDWQKWQEKNLIDELIIQVYRTDMNAFDWELSQPELQQARQSIPVAIGILSGLKGRPIPMVNITQQVKKSRQQNFGVSFFFYETLWNMSNESPSYRRRIFREILQSANPR